MGEGIYNPPAIMVMLLFLSISLIVLIVGTLLRRRGRLRTRGAGLAWAVLVVTPAIAASAVYWAEAGTEVATSDAGSGAPR